MFRNVIYNFLNIFGFLLEKLFQNLVRLQKNNVHTRTCAQTKMFTVWPLMDRRFNDDSPCIKQVIPLYLTLWQVKMEALD